MKNSVITRLNDCSVLVWSIGDRKRLECCIDVADLPVVSSPNCTWYAQLALAPAGKYYVYAKLNGRTTPIHRVIMAATDPMVEVHHIDNDGLNNRRSNLMLCSHRQNTRYRTNRDWDAVDAELALAEEYRKERRIANQLMKHFSLTRAGMFKIRIGDTRSSPAGDAYATALEVGGIRSLFELQRAGVLRKPKGLGSSPLAKKFKASEWSALH